MNARNIDFASIAGIRNFNSDKVSGTNEGAERKSGVAAPTSRRGRFHSKSLTVGTSSKWPGTLPKIKPLHRRLSARHLRSISGGNIGMAASREEQPAGENPPAETSDWQLRALKSNSLRRSSSSASLDNMLFSNAGTVAFPTIPPLARNLAMGTSNALRGALKSSTCLTHSLSAKSLQDTNALAECCENIVFATSELTRELSYAFNELKSQMAPSHLMEALTQITNSLIWGMKNLDPQHPLVTIDIMRDMLGKIKGDLFQTARVAAEILSPVGPEPLGIKLLGDTFKTCEKFEATFAKALKITKP